MTRLQLFALSAFIDQLAESDEYADNAEAARLDHRSSSPNATKPASTRSRYPMQPSATSDCRPQWPQLIRLPRRWAGYRTSASLPSGTGGLHDVASLLATRPTGNNYALALLLGIIMGVVLALCI